ncbi:MAG: Allophanate hydrolase [Frankiales bacterium]|nr:Allophanate hydrolase [Frankiales bacterium]
MTQPAVAITPRQSAAAARALESGQPAFISVLGEDDLEALTALADPTGPLGGLAFAVKDNIDVAGVPTTAANPARTEPAKANAFVIDRLLEAGAVPIGKTNLDQYATGLVGTRSPYGACHSVFSAAHVSGGSSSGSAVAVAKGLVSFALGTDTAGSGRVPAAFNGLVGLKASKGLISTSGVLPACRSLDCVTVLTPSVALARTLFEVAAVFDPADPYARPRPAERSPRSAALRLGARPVIGVPTEDLDLDPVHQAAWEAALAAAAGRFTLVPFEAAPFLEAAQLLYSGPWVAERAVAFGAELEDAEHIDPTVRAIVAGAAAVTGEDAFRGMYRLAELKRATDPIWAQVDAILLPVTPTHPTLADVTAEPVAVNSRLGRFTNMTNLLDLAAIAVPAGRRSDGLPFGVQFLGPAFSDEVLLDVGSLWADEPLPAAEPALLVAVAGAHLTGQPLNADLVRRGGQFVETSRTAADYRMYEVPGPVRRPGVTRIPGGEATGTGLEVELWSLPPAALAGFIATIGAPLGLGAVALSDGRSVLGFICTADGVDAERDITAFGGWRAYLAAHR